MVKFYEAADDRLLQFAVIIARSQGKWVLCKHRERTTLEVPGGHREPGELVDQTAVRELREETGALTFSIRPVCVYSVIRGGAPESFGMLYYADIVSFAPELHSEIERIVLLDELPENPEDWTYPDIQPRLLEEMARRGLVEKK